MLEIIGLTRLHRLVYPIGGGASFSSARQFCIGRSVAEVEVDLEAQLGDDLRYEGGQCLVMRVYDPLGGVGFEGDRGLV